jgi:hypothetical protein
VGDQEGPQEGKSLLHVSIHEIIFANYSSRTTRPENLNFYKSFPIWFRIKFVKPGRLNP